MVDHGREFSVIELVGMLYIDREKASRDLRACRRDLAEARSARSEDDALKAELEAAQARVAELEASLAQCLDSTVGDATKAQETVEVLQAKMASATGHLRRALRTWETGADDKTYDHFSAALAALSATPTTEVKK